MRILVTGGAGFIGSHVSQKLLDLGHELAVLDNLSRGHAHYVPKTAEFIHLDVQAKNILPALEKFRPQAIFHFAAQIDVRHSVAKPSGDADVNVLGTLRLAEVARSLAVQTFIFASTGGAIYGDQTTFPASESHPIKPESPYGISKCCAEMYLDYFARIQAMRTVSLRFGNVYGPRQDPHGEAGVIAIFCHKMLRGEVPTIYGDGKQTRDYVFVEDVVQACISALEKPGIQGAYNIATGVETDLLTVAEHLRHFSKYQGTIHHGAAKPGEQRRSVLAIDRARQTLAYSPQFSLADGLKKTVSWFQSQVHERWV